jgi:preprotein translocase SecF subunit
MAFSLKTTIDFSRWRWHAIILSFALVAAGMVATFTRGVPLGTDFSGGTLVTVEFAPPGVNEEQVRGALAMVPGEAVVQRYGSPDERRFLIRLPLADAAAGDAELEEVARQVSEALQTAPLPGFTVVDRQLVTAVIGDDLQRRGIYATLASIAAITGYIAIRFRWSFAVGGIAATLHDIVVTLACVALAGYDLSLNVVAGLLTITGYSVNDTIVVFDRVRENLRRTSRDPLDQVINLSVNQTLSRTVVTAGTTFLAVLSLFVFGGETLRGFAFTMLVGVVSGTYSTMFIASAIAIRLSARGGARVAG